MSEYSQGVCQDGAAILKDGQMMTIEEILRELNNHKRLSEALSKVLDMAEYMSLHEGYSGSPKEYTDARELLAQLQADKGGE